MANVSEPRQFAGFGFVFGAHQRVDSGKHRGVNMLLGHPAFCDPRKGMIDRFPRAGIVIDALDKDAEGVVPVVGNVNCVGHGRTPRLKVDYLRH